MRRALAMSFVFLAFPLFADERQPDFRLDRVQESLTGTHRHYTQYIDGIEVVGGEKSVVVRNGEVHEVFTRAARASIAAELRVGAPSAKPANGRLVYLNVDGEARLARKVIAQTRPLEPYAEYYDAASGALLRRDPLFWNVKARVFEANPVTKLNDPSLRDQNNAASAVPDAAYSTVDIIDLDPSGSLSGPNVRIVDTEDPRTRAADASQPLLFDRSQPEFEEVNAYFHIDNAKRYLESLGYTGARKLVNYVLPIDAHAANGTDNSYYVSGFNAGQGQLYFGDGGTDDAEDADIMTHEFGHVIQDWIAPGTFTGSSAGNPRALGEGFGDYWSFSSQFAQSIASGRDAFCIAEWDARCAGDDPSERCGYPDGANCLRRTDSTKTMRDYIASDAPGTEHRNGEIWSSALREIFLANVARYGVAEGKRITDTLAIEGTFDVPPSPTYATMARKLLDADRALYGGANSAAICSAMTLREILPASTCGQAPRGELTLFPSAQQGIAIPDVNTTGITTMVTIADTRAIDSLSVNLDIAHSARGDLQITLIAPDGTRVTLQNTSLDRTPNLRATYGVDALPAESLDVFRGRSAAGTWKLVIADVRPRDSGSLVSWSLVIRFAGDEPATSRPRSSGSQTIAVVAHAPGVNGTTFVSDVRLFNKSQRTAHVTAVFTPSSADGTTEFSAVHLTIAPRASVQLNDIVAQTFHTSGAGQLELQGDSDVVVATSRTYTTSANGTYGQFVGAVDTASGMTAADDARIIPQLEVSDAFRTNVGVAEVGGGSGVARFTIFDASGATVDTIDVTIPPHSHVQLPLLRARGELWASLRVVSGDAHVAGYASVVDNRSGDAMFIPAQTHGPSTHDLPTIHSAGVNGSMWRTDVAIVNAGSATVTFTIAAGLHGRPFTVAPHAMLLVRDIAAELGVSGLASLHIGYFADLVVTSRTWTDASERGTFGQFVPDLAATSFAQPMLVTGVEESPAFRTNIGVASPNGDALVGVTVYDAAGNTRGTGAVFVPRDALVQVPLRNFVSGTLTNGVVALQTTPEYGDLYAYGSVVDNSTSDPIFIPAR
jgi:subtilisin-like proprotein convertase family protein